MPFFPALFRLIPFDHSRCRVTAGIRYVPLPGLGGRRRARPDSPNTAWRNAAFRGYADHMASAEYRAARDRLDALARAAPTAMMCAEAMWWQCHRGLIADDFKASGWRVVHLMAPGRAEEHPYTGAARRVDGRLSYSAADDERQSPLF
ncbi:uncharacterized protein DUF488 [Vulcaniibacterium tengchongense]|uniref:Uncharacterized protein DUF488 n=1 Tax=Vulcaniibacterium tengchongense TaxID=1273429 RepID=A0A3N4W6U5_9GAMM|nr:uncharacterized protein DUF488 [Vulcaniibacterium tengchongense]